MQGLLDKLRENVDPAFSGTAGIDRTEQALRDAGVGTPVPTQPTPQPTVQPQLQPQNQPSLDPEGLVSTLLRMFKIPHNNGAADPRFKQ